MTSQRSSPDTANALPDTATRPTDGEGEGLTISRELDLRGLNCPMPVLKTAKALQGVEAGERIAVLASDPLAGLDIPHFCNEQGHVLEDSARDDGCMRFVIRKGA